MALSVAPCAFTMDDRAGVSGGSKIMSLSTTLRTKAFSPTISTRFMRAFAIGPNKNLARDTSTDRLQLILGRHCYPKRSGFGSWSQRLFDGSVGQRRGVRCPSAPPAV